MSEYTDEYEEIKDFINSEDIEKFDNLRSVILPGIQRLKLFEWLLEEFERGIMMSSEVR